MTTTHRPAPPATGHALAVCDLTKTYGDGATATTALSGVDLAFACGTFTAVMGPSGSGKSTLLNCVAGLETPTSGHVTVGGTDITDWGERERTLLRRDSIGFVFQSFHLLPYLTAAQNVELPRVLAGQRPDRARTRELLDRLGIGDRAAGLPTAMSGGQQQRVAIARALAGGAGVILADEPTGALDSRTARDVLALLRAAVDGAIDAERRTVVMVTHDPVAAATADSVVFLVDGRVAGTMHRPTADAVAGQLAHLGEGLA